MCLTGDAILLLLPRRAEAGDEWMKGRLHSEPGRENAGQATPLLHGALWGWEVSCRRRRFQETSGVEKSYTIVRAACAAEPRGLHIPLSAPRGGVSGDAVSVSMGKPDLRQ